MSPTNIPGGVPFGDEVRLPTSEVTATLESVDSETSDELSTQYNFGAERLASEN